MTTYKTKLEQIRSLLKESNLDGFVQFRGDVHQGEYVPDRDSRLEFLTGFSGSAGATVVACK